MVRTLPGGKLELDVAPIRRRLKEVGSVYVARGPHHLVTAQPGLGETGLTGAERTSRLTGSHAGGRSLIDQLSPACKSVHAPGQELMSRVRLKPPAAGNLKSMLAGVRSDSPITAMVAELDRTQVRHRC